VPPGARRIDGRNRWLIPGLFDAHVHINEGAPAAVRPLYLAHGITSIRDMGGRGQALRTLRRQLAEGTEIGPRLFLAGRPIDGDPPKWPQLYADVPRIARSADEARRAVREARADESDFIKLYRGLSAEAFHAAVHEAHAQGLKATADLLEWDLTRIEEAVAAGLDGLEHGLVVAELNSSPGGEPSDLSRVERLLAEMQSRGTAMTTTLVLFERAWTTQVPTDAATFRAMPPALQQQSREIVRWSNEREATWFNAACRAVGLFIARGGTVLAGTDSFFLNVYPGDLHRELELLVRCGLTPAQALAAATRNPAEWLRAQDLGTLATGKLADMVLLRADPLADIRNTQQVELVIQGGRVWTPKELLADAHR
jgi:imidazolonepropionase-like amidohydrolase